MGHVSNNKISRGSFYGLERGVRASDATTLAQRIGLIAEMNTANQATPLTPTLATSRAAMAALYGWGSPVDLCLAILLEETDVPVWVYPVVEAVGATAKRDAITVTGTSTANKTHTLLINGESGTAFGSYDINVTSGLAPLSIIGLIKAAINGALGCPMTAEDRSGIGTATLGVGGTGYAVNDTFTVNTGTTLATGIVTAETAGVVTDFTITYPGDGYSVASGVATTATLGSGTGLTINVTVINFYVETTTVWKGISAEKCTINILTNGNAAGLTYAVSNLAAGSGLPSVQPALDEFGGNWVTIVCDTFGIVDNDANLARYVAFNGNPNDKTGRFDPAIFKPSIYVVGDVIDTQAASADTVICTTYRNECTFAVASAPKSLGLPMQAAAAYTAMFANVSESEFNIDIQGRPLRGIPNPLPTDSAPLQANNYNLRNTLLGMGMTTVIYNNLQYFTQDFALTYHPEGEAIPSWRYCRDLMIDFIIKDLATQLEITLTRDKQIANDNDNVVATNVVKPKDVIAGYAGLAVRMVEMGLISDADFMIASIRAVINATNGNRFDINFSYDRSNVVRVVSNVAQAYN